MRGSPTRGQVCIKCDLSIIMNYYLSGDAYCLRILGGPKTGEDTLLLNTPGRPSLYNDCIYNLIFCSKVLNVRLSGQAESLVAEQAILPPWHCTDKLIRSSSLTLIFLQTSEATSLVVDSQAILHLALLH